MVARLSNPSKELNFLRFDRACIGRYARAMKRPCDFSTNTIETLAKRVAYSCSRATCRRSTVGPHSKSDKSTLVGEAAHICAASPGGPRFDESMTDEERGSASNGIWLCPSCATEIDKDTGRFPVVLLQRWKATAEAEAAQALERPSYQQLGIPRSPFAPPIEYQRQALGQILDHMRRSGVSRATPIQLAHAISTHGLRDGANPIFEPISIESVVDALDELIQTEEIMLDGQQLVLGIRLG